MIKGGLKMLQELKQKLINYFFLIIILVILLYGKLFPSSETNAPSSRDSTPH